MSRGGRRWPTIARRGRARPQPIPARARRRPALTLDGGVVASTGLLAAVGLVMIYSTTSALEMGAALPPHFTRHVGGLAVALACAAAVLRVPLSAWRRLALPLWAGGVALLGLTLFFGVRVNAATRWLEIPGLGLTFQPAEPAKWATLLAVAATLSRGTERAPIASRDLRVALALTLLPAALLLQQPDFGNAALLVALAAMMLFAAGAPLRRLALPGAITAAAGGAFVALNGYAQRRFAGFLDPWRRADDEGFQLVQSFVAFGRGGVFGVGVGDGRQKLGYLPEAHTDFVLSALAEELGLLGVLLVLGAFAALVVAGTRIARRSRDRFALLLAFGMTALLAVPAAVNAAVVMGLLPTTGFTLPFLSYGRTSLVTCALAVGVLLRIAAAESAPRRARAAAPAPRRSGRS